MADDTKNVNNTPEEENPTPMPEPEPQYDLKGNPLPPGFKRYAVFRSIQLKLKPGYVLRKVGQAYMVMPTGPRMKEYQGMITLNETGAFLFKELQKPDATKKAMIDACKAEYGASDEDALKAVDSFINQCADCGMLEFEERVLDKLTGKEINKDEPIES